MQIKKMFKFFFIFGMVSTSMLWGDLTFSGTNTIGYGDNAGGFAIGDLDRDGDLDVVAFSKPNAPSDDQYVWWSENDGAGNFTVHTIDDTDVGYITHVAVGDLDNDGDLDVI